MGTAAASPNRHYHYAWFDVEADLINHQLTIHGWGLQTMPNTPIHTPAPGAAGLALLAMGAAGIRRSRREAA